MSLCESCKDKGECQLWVLKGKEKKAFEGQMEGYQKMKALPNAIPEQIEVEEKRVLGEHIEFQDAQFHSADVLGCPNKFQL